jgi:hypothetical protein
MFRLVFARVDTVHRAHVHAGGVLGADARFGDYISHFGFSFASHAGLRLLGRSGKIFSFRAASANPEL